MEARASIDRWEGGFTGMMTQRQHRPFYNSWPWFPCCNWKHTRVKHLTTCLAWLGLMALLLRREIIKNRPGSDSCCSQGWNTEFQSWCSPRSFLFPALLWVTRTFKSCYYNSQCHLSLGITSLIFSSIFFTYCTVYKQNIYQAFTERIYSTVGQFSKLYL